MNGWMIIPLRLRRLHSGLEQNLWTNKLFSMAFYKSLLLLLQGKLWSLKGEKWYDWHWILFAILAISYIKSGVWRVWRGITTATMNAHAGKELQWSFIFDVKQILRYCYRYRGGWCGKAVGLGYQGRNPACPKRPSDPIRVTRSGWMELSPLFHAWVLKRKKYLV